MLLRSIQFILGPRVGTRLDRSEGFKNVVLEIIIVDADDTVQFSDL